MFGSFFLATVMTALIAQLGSITDSIIMGHLVSPDALSVVRIWQPVENFMFIIIGVMSAGACFLSARGIGAQDYDKVNRVFNHHLYYVIVSALLVIALLLPFVDNVADLVTTNERLQPMLRPYIHAEFFAIFVAVVSGVPLSYIISNGNPRLVTRCIIISQFFNILFDILFCGVFNMGIAGASYATALGDLIAFTSLLPYMHENSRIFCLHRPEKICSIKQYRECFSIGVPMLISALLPKAISETLSMLYFVEGHQKLCRWIKIITNLGSIGVVVIMALYTPELIWYILPVTYWLLLFVIVAMAYVVHRRNLLFSWPTLQITVPSNPAVTFSLPYTIEGVREFLIKVKPFVLACELGKGFHARVALEELLYEIVESNMDRKENETFDVRIIDKNPTFTVVVKSKGHLQNPIYKFSDDNIMNVDDSDLRLAVLSKVCKNISHKYMNGINCIYLNYHRQGNK